MKSECLSTPAPLRAGVMDTVTLISLRCSFHRRGECASIKGHAQGVECRPGTPGGTCGGRAEAFFVQVQA